MPNEERLTYLGAQVKRSDYFYLRGGHKEMPSILADQ
jgi:hypothetical protein